MSYSSIQKIIRNLGDASMAIVQKASKAKPGMLNYDNLNMETSIHVEQREDGPAKVTSGTYAIWIELVNADFDSLLLDPIRKRFATAPLLSRRDLEPSVEQQESVSHQMLIHAISVLSEYHDSSAYLNNLMKHPELQHKVRRPLPANHKTKFYGLRASTTEEIDVEGNLALHDEFWVSQLQFSIDQLNKYAMITIDDQLTNSRIRSAQLERAKDVDSWERRETLQVSWAPFHGHMNLAWLVLHIHRGSIEECGSLSWFFAILEKRRLAGEKPDYYTLIATFKQILDGILLNGWLAECGYPSLQEFIESRPSPQQLLNIAAKVLQNHANPTPPVHNEDFDKDGVLPPDIKQPCDDPISHNLRLLARDLLYLREFEDATRDGDFGRIEDMIPQLAMMFCGAGGKNYCGELLRFLWNLKHAWTPELR
jgi:hypothetical protein